MMACVPHSPFLRILGSTPVFTHSEPLFAQLLWDSEAAALPAPSPTQAVRNLCTDLVVPSQLPGTIQTIIWGISSLCCCCHKGSVCP